MRLLDIFCEAIDPSLYNLRASDHNLQLSSLTGRSLIEGKPGSAKGGFIAQAIQQVRYVSTSNCSIKNPGARYCTSWLQCTKHIF